MDGASRFTQRDAVASILITGINIIAGFLIGVLQHGMDLRKAPRDLHRADHRRRPGDGDSGADDLHLRRPDRDPRQLRRAPGRRISASRSSATRSRCCWRAACWWPWRHVPGPAQASVPAAGRRAGRVGWRMRRTRHRGEAAPPEPSRRRRKENLEALLRVEPLAVEVGLGLVELVEGGQELAAAAAHLRHPPAAGHRSGLPACRRCA